jgi:hypothetical protein
MKDYDRNKFVVLVSAGPTARRVKYSNNYYTCGVNVTPKLIEKTNFWVVNDACYFQDFSEEELQAIENLALPEFPHSVNGIDMKPQPQMNYKKVTENLSQFMNVHPFNIHTSRKFNLPYDPSIIYFETRSSNESALRWLVHCGFTKFISIGQDPEGCYHPKMHSRPTRQGGHIAIHEPLDNNRYKEVQNRMKAVITENDCLMIRCILPMENTFDDSVWEIFHKMESEKGYKEIEVST